MFYIAAGAKTSVVKQGKLFALTVCEVVRRCVDVEEDVSGPDRTLFRVSTFEMLPQAG